MPTEPLIEEFEDINPGSDLELLNQTADTIIMTAGLNIDVEPGIR